MSNMTRSEAIRQRSPRFFTGKPCKRGHITYRYTKNGGCSDCINPKFASADQEIRQRAKSVIASGVLRRNGFVIHSEDVCMFEALALFYARLREPGLRLSDLQTRRAVQGQNGFALRLYWTHPDDRLALEAVEASLKGSR